MTDNTGLEKLSTIEEEQEDKEEEKENIKKTIT